MAYVDRLEPTEGYARWNPLAVAIGEEIRHRNRAIPFADYMRYWNRGIATPGGRVIPGYYTGPDVSIGLGNNTTDFSTTPEITPMFGYLLARKIMKVWEATGRDPEFTIVEMGAGNGTMARDIMDGLEYFAQRTGIAVPVKYTIVESSPTLLAKQQERLEGYPVTFIEASAAEVQLPPFTGVVVTNELLDDMTVRPYQPTGHGWKELFVTEQGDSDQFHQEWRPVEAETAAFLDSRGITTSPDRVYYYNFEAEKWMRNVAASLQKGAVITIDYPHYDKPLTIHAAAAKGEIPFNLFGPIYLQKPLVGRVNITTGVDFEMLRQIGEEAGLQKAEYSTQGEFMYNCGYSGLKAELGAHFGAGLPKDDERRVRYGRHSEQSLLSSGFRALVQTTPNISLPRT